jgi:hypothetical protein
MAHVDAFVVYDHIKYTKKGWINRNRLLLNDTPVTFSLPLQADSDYLNICERHIAATFNPLELIRKFEAAYAKSAFFAETAPLIHTILRYEQRNLFDFIFHSIGCVCQHLQITTPLIISSTVEASNDLKNQDRVIGICKTMNATTYVNPIGGVELYRADEFQAHGIALEFLQSRLSSYPQRASSFVPALSIIDVLACIGKAGAQALIQSDFQLLSSTTKVDNRASTGVSS